MGEEKIQETGYALFALRQALIEGEASRDYAPFDFDAFIAERRAAQEQKQAPAHRETMKISPRAPS